MIKLVIPVWTLLALGVVLTYKALATEVIINPYEGIIYDEVEPCEYRK